MWREPYGGVAANTKEKIMSNWIPNGTWGWVGAGILVAALVWHKSLSTFGLILAVAAGGYLYFVVDSNVSTAATS